MFNFFSLAPNIFFKKTSAKAVIVRGGGVEALAALLDTAAAVAAAGTLANLAKDEQNTVPRPTDVDRRNKKMGKNHGFELTKNKNYFTSSDPHRDIILKHIRHKFWHSFCPSVSRFHQNYPLLLVPSPGSGSSSDHCDLSSQTDSNWLSLCLIQNNFRRPSARASPDA